jgi:hypothetical protein
MTELYFADKKVEEDYIRLKNSPEHKELYKHIKRALEDIKNDCECGIAIAKRLIPKIYIKKYGINNLFKYDLPAGWRLLYSLEEGKIEIMAIILEWMNHKNYEKRFGY